MSRRWLLALALSLGLNAGLLYVDLSGRRSPEAASPALHRGPGGPPIRPGGPPPDPARLARRRVERMVRVLDLDDSARAALERAVDDALPRIFAARDEVREARHAFRATYRSFGLDAEALRDRRREMTAKQAVLDSLVTEALLREAAVLTAEQRERYAESMPWEPRPPPGRRGQRGE